MRVFLTVILVLALLGVLGALGVGVVTMIRGPRGLIDPGAPTVFLRNRQAISADLVKEGHG